MLISRAAAAILCAAALQACQSSGGQPSAAPGLKNTGEYPKIGHIPVGETAQLGPGGSAALRSQLSAAHAAQATNADAAESYAEKLRRLRLLKAKHAAETLAAIEATKAE